MNDYLKTLQVLCDAEVRFVIIGGAAAAAHGSTYPTYDLDICYDRSPESIERLADALKPFHPRLRGVSDKLPFCFDAATIARGMNFTLATDLGDIDLFGEVAGIGGYKDVSALSIPLNIAGWQCPVLSLDGLIQSKRATARPKDVLVLAEMEALREMETPAKHQSEGAKAPRQGHAEDKQTKT
jgi:hypothetical protein